MLRSLTVADKLLLGILSLGTLVSFAVLFRPSSGSGTVTIEVDREVVFTADLDTPRSIIIPGSRGEVTFEIANGEIRASGADCPNQVCVRTGWRHRDGDVIVCVPNNLIMRIGKAKGGAVEAVTG